MPISNSVTLVLNQKEQLKEFRPSSVTWCQGNLEGPIVYREVRAIAKGYGTKVVEVAQERIGATENSLFVLKLPINKKGLEANCQEIAVLTRFSAAKQRRGNEFIIQLCAFFILEIEKGLDIPIPLFPFYKGGNLFDFVYDHTDTGLSAQRTWEATRGLMKALVHLKELEVLHRDIKPDNILIDGEGRFFLADFGLAAFMLDQKRRLNPCGTPEFCSPERTSEIFYEESKRHLYDYASDMWALGLTLYEIYTRKFPFKTPLEGEKVDEYFKRLVTDQKELLESNSQKPYEKNLLQKNLECITKDKAGNESKYALLLEDLFEKILTLDPKKRLSAEVGMWACLMPNMRCVE